MYTKNDKIYHAYVSKDNPNHERKLILFYDSKRRKMALSFSQKTIHIGNTTNLET